MRYEVYLDAVILIQFVMNYCVLRLTESLMRLKTSRLRVVLASLAGAFGSCLLFLPIGLNACTFCQNHSAKIGKVSTKKKKWHPQCEYHFIHLIRSINNVLFFIRLHLTLFQNITQ